VGCFFYVSAYEVICQQKVDVVFYVYFGDYLFSGNDIYLPDIFLFSGRAYISVEDIKEKPSMVYQGNLL
jgi:hypothetical protein